MVYIKKDTVAHRNLITQKFYVFRENNSCFELMMFQKQIFQENTCFEKKNKENQIHNYCIYIQEKQNMSKKYDKKIHKTTIKIKNVTKISCLLFYSSAKQVFVNSITNKARLFPTTFCCLVSMYFVLHYEIIFLGYFYEQK